MVVVVSLSLRGDAARGSETPRGRRGFSHNLVTKRDIFFPNRRAGWIYKVRGYERSVPQSPISRIDGWNLEAVQSFSPKPQEPLKSLEGKRTCEGQIWAWCALSSYQVSSLIPLGPTAGFLDSFSPERVPNQERTPSPELASVTLCQRLARAVHRGRVCRCGPAPSHYPGGSRTSRAAAHAAESMEVP